MPELQPFEARLAVAVRSFADRADTRVHATAVAERSIRSRPSAGVGWLGRTVSVPVWILLVIGLLLALFAAALQAGSLFDVRPPALASCAAGADPDRPGPADQERPASDGYGYPVTFDRPSGRLVAVAGDLAELWTFDVCTNTWRRSDVRPPATHVDMLERVRAIAYDERADLTVLFSDWVMAYDVESDTLDMLGRRPVSENVHAVSRTATGQLLVRDDDTARLWTYDVVTDVWAEIAQRGELPPPGTGASLLAYDMSVDHLVLYMRAGNRTEGYEFDPDSSTWLRQPEDPPALSLFFGDLGRHEVAFDEANARTVLFSSGQVITYDAAARDWQLVFDSHMDLDPPPTPGDPTHRTAISLVYDPLNERVITVGGSRRTETDWMVADDVIAFDLDSRTWIELLAPSSP